MKQALPRLILAAAALAAALSACGGSDPITSSPPLPKQPVLDNSGATRTAGLTAFFAAARPSPDDPGGDPPGKTPPANPPASGLSEDGLDLLVENGEAKVCQPKGGVLVCAQVEAPLPPGTTVRYWHSPDGSGAVTYVRTPGVSDPDGATSLRFQAAFNGAARAVLAYPGTNARAPGGQAREMACDNEDCVEEVPTVDVPGERGGGGGGGGGSGGGGGGDGGGGGGDTNTPVVMIHGVPDPATSIPVIVVLGHDGPIPLLPPRDPLYDLAELDNKCVHGPFMTVCIRGQRPPLPPSERLPSGPMPWFPQSWCDFAHILCTSGQEQRDHERIPGSETSGKTLEELYDICDAQDAVNVAECNAYRAAGADAGIVRACFARTMGKLAACRQTARRLTDNGAHPAP